MKFIVVIKYLGSYYVLKESKNSMYLEFPEFELENNKHYSSNDFNQSNIKIKKDIVDVIIHNTPFRNRSWSGENAYKAVSLQCLKVKDDSRGRDHINLVVFSSNELNVAKKNEFIPYVSGLYEHCNSTTKTILSKMKLQNNWSFVLFYVPLFVLFALPFVPGYDVPFNSDALQFVFASLGGLFFIVKRHFPTEKYLAKFNNCPFMGNIAMFDFLLIAGILMISFIVSFYIPEIWNSIFSKICLMILLVDSAIQQYQRDI